MADVVHMACMTAHDRAAPLCDLQAVEGNLTNVSAAVTCVACKKAMREGVTIRRGDRLAMIGDSISAPDGKVMSPRVTIVQSGGAGTVGGKPVEPPAGGGGFSVDRATIRHQPGQMKTIHFADGSPPEVGYVKSHFTVPVSFEGTREDGAVKLGPPPTDLDAFRGMLERAGIRFRASDSAGQVSEFVKLKFDVDGRLAAVVWFGSDGVLTMDGER